MKTGNLPFTPAQRSTIMQIASTQGSTVGNAYMGSTTGRSFLAGDSVMSANPVGTNPSVINAGASIEGRGSVEITQQRDPLMQNSVFTNFADGSSIAPDFGGSKGFGTVQQASNFSPRKKPDLLKQISFCRDRLLERDLHLKHPAVFSKLKAMSNPREKTTPGHIHLYYCYVDMIREAVTQDDKDIADRHLSRCKKWFDTKLPGTEFSNKQRGADAEAFYDEMEQEMETFRLYKMI